VKDVTCSGVFGGGCGGFNCPNKTEKPQPLFTEIEDEDCGGRLLACVHNQRYHAPFDARFAGSNPGFAYVTMVRDPVDQMLSTILYFCFTAGTEEGWPKCFLENQKWKQGSYRKFHDPQTKMLLGTNATVAATLTGQNVTVALRNLLSLDFFGITHRWTESICLFHAVFGGEPRASQFLNVRPGPQYDPPPLVVQRARENTKWDRVLFEQAAEAFQCRIDQVLASAQGSRYRACVKQYQNAYRVVTPAPLP
jgi:hypothetical protein